jgi:hypothetical protein
MAGGGIGEAALIGAVIGGGSSALTGRDPLQGALLGGLTSGIGSGISGLLGGGASAVAPELVAGVDTGLAAGINSAASAASPTGLAALQSTAVPQSVLDQSIAQEMALNKPATQLLVDPGVYAAPVSPATQAAIDQSIAGEPSFSHRISQVAPAVQSQTPVFDAIKSLGTSIGDNQKGTTTQALKDIGSSVLGKIGDNPVPYALSGIVPLAMLDPKKTDATPVEKYEGPLSKFKYDPNTFQPYTPQPPNPVYRPVYNSYGLPTIYAAAGGSVEQMSQANSVGANTGYPQADIRGHAYSTPWQTPVSQNMVTGTADTGVNPITGQMAFAGGGIADLGSYSDGGRMLKGPGDGMSDSIPATIANKRPARLANEEFVVPADVVSHLGNGSSDAGAKQLYAMMDRVRKARTGTKQQGREINPTKYMPA